MKIVTKTAEVQSNAVFDESVKMTIENESIAHIIKSLTDIYEDPYLAISREYISNSFDALIEAQGVDDASKADFSRPIEVSLPTRLNPAFVVRDYGVGMSREVLGNVFPKYGASTKRKDNSQVGGFGLGAKSALSIASNFVVVSVKDGKKNTAIIQKGEDGVGVVSFLEEQETTEPSGTVVTITLPDPNRLTSVFRDSNLLLGFPQSSIVIDGKVHSNSVYNEDIYTKISDDGWVANNVLTWDNRTPRPIAAGWDTKVVLVGPISYSFSRSKLSENGDSYGSEFATLDKYTILNLPIGSVDLTPSRDNLIFTDRTRKAIIEGSKRLKAEMEAYAVKHVASAESRKDAVNRVEALAMAGFTEDYEYNGEVVPRKIFVPLRDKDQGIETWYSGVHHKTSVKKMLSPVNGGNAVLVYGVAHQAEATTLNRFRKAFATKFAGLTDSYNLIFTSAPREALSVWTECFVDAIFSVDEFTAKGSELRKVINAERRAARGTTGAGRSNTGAVPVSVLQRPSYQYDRPKAVSFSSASLQNRKVVYVQVDKSNTDTFSTRFAQATAGGSERSMNVMVNRGIHLVEDFFAPGEATSVVRVPANTKLETFLSVVPDAVSMDEALKVASANLIASVDLDNIAFMRNDSNVDWALLISHKLDEIVNLELRTWVEKAYTYASLNHRETARLREQNNILTFNEFDVFFKEFNEKVDSVKMFNFSIINELRYPSRNMSQTVEAELIEYLNFKVPAEN